MSVVGIIPARWGSTRLPGKSLVDLGGKPMIQWVYERACGAERLDSVWVATDDVRIAEAVKTFGGGVVMTRSDHPSGTDRIAEAVAQMDASLVVNVQGDEPLLNPSLIDKLVGAMEAEDYWDMGTAATPFTEALDVADPSLVKVVFNEAHQALYFSRAVIPFKREATDVCCYWRHLGLYAYRRDFLSALVKVAPCEAEQAERLEQLRALHIGGRMVVVETEDLGIGVDTAEDVERVREMIRARA